MNEAVLYEAKGAIAHVTLNRPEQMNAMNIELIDGLADAMEKARAPEIRAVVLKANGRCFCAGGDIRAFNRFLDEGKSIPAAMPDRLHEMVETMRNLEKPILASVQGPAAGAGAPLALACDLVVAAEEAIFNFAYARIGLTPDGSSTYFLPRHVGMKKATEIFMMLPTYTAKEAMELGLVNWVVPGAELASKTEAFARQLSEGPTAAFGRLKKLMNATYENTLHDQLAFETKLICDSSRTADFREGIKAFLGKRTPQFKGV
ncbi:MAG TPA: enoyl-CoA hydratase-related protein [bacterium]|nr:enoyl-CoA hydratase-related protein [bacterium]